MKHKTWHDDVFFGLHFDLHTNADDTELGRDLTVDHLVEQLTKIQPDFVQCDCKGHPGYTSYPTKIGCPSPGIVKDAVRMWRDATSKMGIPLGMHYSGVWDTAALALHPDWGRVNSPKARLEVWPKPELGEGNHDKNMTCPKSEYTDRYMIPQLLEIIDAYDVDGFWVDGENWASAPCYCEACKAGFVEQLGKTVPVPEQAGEAYWPEWLAYSRENFVDHVRRYAKAVHQRKPSCTVCSNWMYTVRQPEPMTVPVDYISGDFSWIWSVAKASVEARFMDSRGISWDLMAWAFSSHGKMQDWVFKSADALCQEAGVVMACGGAFMIYDTPNRAGTLVKWHMDELAKVAAFCRARQPFCQKAGTVPQVAVLHAASHYYANNEPLFNLAKADNQVEGALHAFLENNYSVDILNTEDLMGRLHAYPLVVLSEQDNLDASLIPVLSAYVEKGGHLLVSGAEHTKAFDALLGVRSCDTPATETVSETAAPQKEDFFIPCEPGTVCAMGQWRQVKPMDENTVVIEPLLLSRDAGNDRKDSGYCAATVRSHGRGKIAGIYGPVFGTYAYSHYPAIRTFIGKVVRQMESPRLMRIDAPALIQVTLRQKASQIMINLVNLGTSHPLSPNAPIVEHVPPAGPVRIRLPMEERPEKVILMPSATPLDWQYTKGELALEVKSIGIHDIVVIDTLPVGASREATSPN